MGKIQSIAKHCIGSAALLFGNGLCGNAAADDMPAKGYEGPKENLHVYLLIGGSTMAGEGDLTQAETGIIDRLYLLNEKGDWEPAKIPFNRYSTIRGDNERLKLGPGLSFAKAMLEKDKDISIGLVVNAGGGSLIEDWHMKSAYYRGARGRTKSALKTGTLKGVLWHHGGRSFVRSRLDPLKTLVTNLRADFELLNLPFVVGEVPNAPDMNSIIAAFSADVHATGIAGAKDLNSAGGKRLDAQDMRVLGERYAERMLNVQSEWGAGKNPAARRNEAVIDAHIHAYANHANGLDKVAEWMEKNNIERAIVHELTPTRPGDEHERGVMVANFRKYRGKIYRFCVIDPGEVNSVEEAVEILRKEKADGAIGFGEHYGRNLMFDDPRNMRLYAACEKVGLPVMFHMDRDKNMDEAGLPRLERVLKTFPNCVLIAHAEWWLQLPNGTCDRLLREYPNLYTDPSGLRMVGMLNRDRGYTREFLIRNADKILFGSDAGWWSIGNAQAKEQQFTLFEELDLPAEVKTKIYRSNAEKLFGFADDSESPRAGVE